MRKTLLLADDSLTVRHVIEQTFADEPIDVVTVGDGAAALVRLGGDPPDVLLADIGMPGPDGYELALHMRRTPALAHIPVLLLTGAFDPVDHARARDAGCAGVLVKPFDPQMLIARVRQLLEPRRPAAGAPVPDGAAQNAVLPLSAESRAAQVDDYFAHLDRAFATLQASGDGGHRNDASTAHAHSSVTGAITHVGDPPERAGTPTPTSAGGGAQLVVDAASVPPVLQERATPITLPVVTVAAEDHVARPPAAPTLGDAFAALLAIEQGRPLPPAANGWTPAPSAEVLEQMIRRVTQEIAEAVIRDLAPGIVSEVAERLVREEAARLTSPLPRP